MDTIKFVIGQEIIKVEKTDKNISIVKFIQKLYMNVHVAFSIIAPTGNSQHVLQ